MDASSDHIDSQLHRTHIQKQISMYIKDHRQNESPLVATVLRTVSCTYKKFPSSITTRGADGRLVGRRTHK